MAEEKKYVFVCMNVDCRTKGATPVMERLQARVQGNGGPGVENVEVRPYMCFGGCHDGPNVIVYPDKVWYAGVQKDDADKIVDQHLKQGETVKREVRRGALPDCQPGTRTLGVGKTCLGWTSLAMSM